MHATGIGIDLIEVSRFREIGRSEHEQFFANTFSETEIEYCFSYKDPASHLAGIFAAKEAVQKASGVFSLPLNKIEIRKKDTGQPEVWMDGKCTPSLIVSITHSDVSACAVALNQS